MLDNIDPIIWGSIVWDYLEIIIMAYPNNPTDEDKTDMINLINAVHKMLPCHKCRYNFTHHLKKHPLNSSALASKYDMLMWLVNMHNEVNIMTGKPLMTYDDVINKIQNKQKSPINKQIITFVLLVLLFVILILFTKYRT